MAVTTPRFLLDSNAVIALLNQSSKDLDRRVRRELPGAVAISVIVLHELYYGAFRSRRVDENARMVDALQFPVLALDPDDARQAGRIRAELAAAGTPIGPYDVLIAGQALARGLTLLSRNTAEFRRVAGLKWEQF